MSAGSVSLESSIRTCKVNAGWATKVQSDRFQNPNLMVCPVWNGVDSAGRLVCPDSFYTKRAGCNSAEDRVVVENNVSRPQYIPYVNLDAAGIAGNIYGNTLPSQQEIARTKSLRSLLPSDKSLGITGQFGLQTEFGQNVLQGCNAMGSSAGPSAYNRTYPSSQPERYQMAAEAQQRRMGQSLQNGSQSYSHRVAAGF